MSSCLLYFPIVPEGSTLTCPSLRPPVAPRALVGRTMARFPLLAVWRMNIRLAPWGNLKLCRGNLCCYVPLSGPRSGGTERSSSIHRPCVLALHGAGKLSDAVGAVELNRVFCFCFFSCCMAFLSLETETRCRAKCMNATRIP